MCDRSELAERGRSSRSEKHTKSGVANSWGLWPLSLSPPWFLDSSSVVQSCSTAAASLTCVCWRVCVCVCSDDEHMLIQHYCQSLNQGSPLSQPRSPAQILISMETEEKGELERVLNDLEQENRSASRTVLSIITCFSFSRSKHPGNTATRIKRQVICENIILCYFLSHFSHLVASVLVGFCWELLNSDNRSPVIKLKSLFCVILFKIQ